MSVGREPRADSVGGRFHTGDCVPMSDVRGVGRESFVAAGGRGLSETVDLVSRAEALVWVLIA